MTSARNSFYQPSHIKCINLKPKPTNSQFSAAHKKNIKDNETRNSSGDEIAKRDLMI